MYELKMSWLFLNNTLSRLHYMYVYLHTFIYIRIQPSYMMAYSALTVLAIQNPFGIVVYLDLPIELFYSVTINLCIKDCLTTKS